MSLSSFLSLLSRRRFIRRIVIPSRRRLQEAELFVRSIALHEGGQENTTGPPSSRHKRCMEQMDGMIRPHLRGISDDGSNAGGRENNCLFHIGKHAVVEVSYLGKQGVAAGLGACMPGYRSQRRRRPASSGRPSSSPIANEAGSGTAAAGVIPTESIARVPVLFELSMMTEIDPPSATVTESIVMKL